MNNAPPAAPPSPAPGDLSVPAAPDRSDAAEHVIELDLGWTTVRVTGTGLEALRAEVVAGGDGTCRVRVHADRATAGGALEIGWRLPCTEAAVFWSPRDDGDPWIPMAVGNYRFTASAARYAPLGVVLDHDGRNLMAFGVSETVRPVVIGAGVDDLTLAADFITTIRLELSDDPVEPYLLDILLDPRPLPLATILTSLTDWYATDNRCGLTPPQPHTQAAVYSTWYCFQQTVTATAVLAEAQKARSLGFGTVIVDDGWQTHDISRDYAYCGDWEPDAGKFPDMAAFVSAIQQLGMRCMLWIAPLLLGRRSSAWPRLSTSILGFSDEWQAGILDPREPAVRAHLIRQCARAVREWNIDGLKIDFIDALAQIPTSPSSPTADCDSVAEGADRLLAGITTAVAAYRPDLIVEFRQEYVSPRLWRYGNLLRAFDCPYDAVENRVRTIRARLLAGPAVAHSDPITWHPASTSTAVARHLLNAAFAVPQISMRLDMLSDDHEQVVAGWLRLTHQWRDVLLSGQLTADRPELNHPSVTAYAGSRAVVASYADVAIPVPSDDQPHPEHLLVLNGGGGDRVLLDLARRLGHYAVTIRDCLGQTQRLDTISLGPGIHQLGVPAGGTAQLRRASSCESP